MTRAEFGLHKFKNQYISGVIVFPNAKINVGLHVTSKRPDGFHNIETVFYPIGWHDVLEVVENRASAKAFNLHTSGRAIDGPTEENILYKAYQLISRNYLLPNIDVYLHKSIPMGAGLGGGSADAAFFISLINELFHLGMPMHDTMTLARQLGSDCAFFIENRPVYASQKGDVFEEITFDLSAYHIAVVYPNVHSNTKEAYSLVKPMQAQALKSLVKRDISDWKKILKNDFEPSVFSKYPVVETIKQSLYEKGALYACMSGSGSAVFGLFATEPVLGELAAFPHWVGKQ